MKYRARNLRRQQTEAEQRLWHYLRNRRLAGFKFRRQHVLGPYIVDFVCLESHLVVEVDGGQHGAQQEYDDQRSAFLEAQGFKVVRYWNNEVLKDTQAVLRVIHRALVDPHPNPLPSLGEGGSMVRGA